MLTFNPQSTLSWNWVTLSGPDARDFLHRLTTVHVNALLEGHGAPGFFLDPQGKVKAYFTLWNFGPGDYAFEFESGQSEQWKNALLATIDHYTFAEKITVTDVTALECRWFFSENDRALVEKLGAPGLEPKQTLALDDEIRLCHHGLADFGRAWVSAWGRPERLSQWADRMMPPETVPKVSLEEIERWRIAALRPRVGHEILETTVPLEAGLTDAIASNKGCYPGQEVIEKIISLGSPAKRLALIEGVGTACAGETLFNLAEPPVEVGQLTSVATAGGGLQGLAYLRKIHAKEGMELRVGKDGPRAQVTRVAPYA